MGCVASAAGIETPEIDTQKVESIVEDYGKTLSEEIPKETERFKNEMRYKAPEPWQVDKDVGDAKVFLTHEVDDDKKVKKTVLLACTGSKFKSDVQDAVWNGISGDVESKISDKPDLVKKATRKAARTASDKAAEKAVDKMIERYANKIESGEL